MHNQPSPAPLITEQGIALIDLVIERVRRTSPAFQAIPLPPEVIATLTFPSGKPLPPSLQRWLSFDARWLFQLGWLSSLETPQFTPRRLEEIVRQGIEYAGWAHYYVPLGNRFSECFLLGAGGESCRILVVSEPDKLGEYPVLIADTDDIPLLEIAYPGLDVYLAAGWQLPIPRRGNSVDWTFWFDGSPYRQRLISHANHLFRGHSWVFVDDSRPEGYEVMGGEGEEDATRSSADPSNEEEFPC
jgi:hypothetical protein